MTDETAFVVVGAGGHAREVASLVLATGNRLAGFLDDRPPSASVIRPFAVPYLGAVSEWREGGGNEFLLGVGSGPVRELLSRKLGRLPPAQPLVSFRADLGVDVRMDSGVVIFAQATVTTNVSLGKHVHVGRGAAIGHDCVVGDFATVMPLASVSGDVYIGERATIGSGAVVRQGQRIGADSFVGAGAVVVSDVPAGATVVGNPARLIRR
ncbi:acetyltransferase [Dietzia maris]|uniref:acetyltransferase n=1 Tax=Dietzia maris TaxID=37915 RepID=UPI00104A0584